MYLGVDYFPFDATEGIVLGIDFVNDLAPGDSVSSATITSTVAADSQVTDPTPAARIVAGPSYLGTTIVTYKFQSPVAGCKYLISCTATTANNETITDYTHLPCEVPL